MTAQVRCGPRKPAAQGTAHPLFSLFIQTSESLLCWLEATYFQFQTSKSQTPYEQQLQLLQ